ncbi:unnamed protein product [Caenorhabditis auriculariae]|uniref:Major facilitator superfamily (MFS) profile domain-containing protein n=1 Tax=Caenorhabditis auriculariae TaxID=2777116 RepID=A0A8S1HA86_9PELO|nr:unnamed protein product [Caenorhabditis auriculariae]
MYASRVITGHNNSSSWSLSRTAEARSPGFSYTIHYTLSSSRRNWIDYAQKNDAKDRKTMLSTLSTTRLRKALTMWFDINRFHLLVLFTWQFSIFFASQQIFPIFSNYVPQWQCEDEPPSKNCAVYEKCQGNVTFVNPAFQSAAMEYKWICGNSAYFASLFSQIQFAGVLCGTFSFGALSDILGRKPIAVFALSLGIFMNFVTGLAPSYQVLMAIRFFVGLSVGGTLVVVCTFVMEMLLPQQRMALRAFFNWGVARLLMTLICMAFPEWRMSSIACAVAALPALIIIIFAFPESPTWLHNKGRLEEMRASERHIAKVAGIPYVPVEHKKNRAFKDNL